MYYTLKTIGMDSLKLTTHETNTVVFKTLYEERFA